MGRYLGFRRKRGALSASNPFSAGSWSCRFLLNDLGIKERDFEIFHIAISGPNDPACKLQVFLDDIFYSMTVRGDANDYDPNQAIPVRQGQTVNFYWNTTVTPAPVVTIFCRLPDVI